MLLIVSLLAFIGIHVFVMTLTGGLSNFYNLPSILMVFPTAILFGVGATSFKGAKLALRMCFKETSVNPSSDVENAIRFFYVTGSSAIYLGLAPSFSPLFLLVLTF